MPEYEYKTVAAPRRATRHKGVKGKAALFAKTVEEVIQEHAVDGWEYMRAEALVADEKGGVFKRRAETFHSILIFRKEKIDHARAINRPTLPSLETAPPVREPFSDAPEIKIAVEDGDGPQKA